MPPFQTAFLEHTNVVVVPLKDDDVALVDDGTLSLDRVQRRDPQRAVENYQKEILEQADSVVNTMRGRVDFDNSTVVLGGIKDFFPQNNPYRRLVFIACGTSYHSAIATRQVVEELMVKPVTVELASDFLDREPLIFRDDVCFFISQSGETADTLMALHYCKQRGALIVGVTNTVGSSIYRESHCRIHINVRPEIGVTSNKAYTSQILSLVMFALVMSEDLISMQPRRAEIIRALKELPGQIRQVLELDTKIWELADQIYEHKSLLVMGRGYNFATCLEGALKVMEFSNMHCEGIMSGELKHGPLAMVDAQMPIVMIICKDSVYLKSLKVLEQVVARQGHSILICDADVPLGDLKGHHHVLQVPKTLDCLQNILTVIPLHLLSYHIRDSKHLSNCITNAFRVD